MALAIRLTRGGRKALPHYSIIVADKRMPRDGRFIEKLGTYNPLSNDDTQRVKLVEERIKYWLSQGAKPSERVAIFLGKAGIIPMPAQPARPTKSAQSEKTKLRIAEKEEKRKNAIEAAKAAEEEAKAAAIAAAEAAKAEAEAAKAAAEAPAPAPEEAPAAEAAPEAAAEAPAEEPAAAEEPKAE
jgi:small subunit ribosomal protein S16